MRKFKRRACRPHGAQSDGLSRVFRGAWLYGGIPFLILSAIFIATQLAPGLADFIFWLTAIWIILVRYVEFSNILGKTPHPGKSALRKWQHFSIILMMAAGVLYALARVATP